MATSTASSAADGSKHWGKAFFLLYTPFWLTLCLGVVVPIKLYERFTELEYLILGLVSTVPAFLTPLFLVGKFWALHILHRSGVAVTISIYMATSTASSACRASTKCRLSDQVSPPSRSCLGPGTAASPRPHPWPRSRHRRPCPGAAVPVHGASVESRNFWRTWCDIMLHYKKKLTIRILAIYQDL